RIRSIFNPGFGRFGKKYVNFTGMKLSEVVDRIAESRAVIDVNRPNQMGLTMRTIEAVGAQRKLITTNVDIVNYDLYQPRSVLIVQRDNPIVDDEFLFQEGLPFNESLRDCYSASSWVDCI